MGKARTAGFRFRAGVWHINGIIVEGRPLYRSLDTSSAEEACRLRDQVIRAAREEAQAAAETRRLASLYGVRPAYPFKELAIRFLEDPAVLGKRSVSDTARVVQYLVARIGAMDIAKIHDDSLRPLVLEIQARGAKSRTVRATLEVVRRMLRLAASKYRHPATDLTLLAQAPAITLPPMEDKRPPYPLTWVEQRLLFQELPTHLAGMALYAVNTGCRDEEIAGLRWAWENRVAIRGAARSVFVLPRTKNGLPRAVVLNEVAQSVVDAQRGISEDYVFTYDGHRVNAVNQSAWRKARSRAAAKYPGGAPEGFSTLHFHDLRHTVGRRLRAAGVSNETRADILGHRNGNMTTDYSQAELTELFDALQLIAREGEQAPTMLRVVNG